MDQTAVVGKSIAARYRRTEKGRSSKRLGSFGVFQSLEEERENRRSILNSTKRAWGVYIFFILFFFLLLPSFMLFFPNPRGEVGFCVWSRPGDRPPSFRTDRESCGSQPNVRGLLPREWSLCISGALVASFYARDSWARLPRPSILIPVGRNLYTRPNKCGLGRFNPNKNGFWPERLRFWFFGLLVGCWIWFKDVR